MRGSWTGNWELTGHLSTKKTRATSTRAKEEGHFHIVATS
jgi:hypothetical protein